MAEINPANLQSKHLYVQALLLGKVVKHIFDKASIRLSSKPKLTARPIISFMKRMRVSGLEKFSGKTFLSVINFYRSDTDLKRRKTAGALVVYISEENIYHLVKQLDYPVENEEDHAALMDSCGALTNLVAGSFKSGLIELGYQEIRMSHFSSYENTVIDGVEYDPRESQYYEVVFEVQGQPCLTIDLTMGPLEHDGQVEATLSL